MDSKEKFADLLKEEINNRDKKESEHIKNILIKKERERLIRIRRFTAAAALFIVLTAAIVAIGKFIIPLEADNTKVVEQVAGGNDVTQIYFME